MRFSFLLISLLSFLYGSCQTYAILADRLIDGSSGDAIANPTVIVYKNKILDINYTRSIPDSAIVIDLKGYSILPGLIDVHTHLLADGASYESDLFDHSPSYRALRAVMHLRIALSNGITTLRDVCSEGAGFADVDLSRAVDSGFVDGPRILPAGKGIAATGQYLPATRGLNWETEFPAGTQYATGVNECIKAVREQISHGVKWIKLFADWHFTPTFNKDEIDAIVSEAAKYNIGVAAHAVTKAGIRMAIEAGAKSIEHGLEFNDSLIQLALIHHTFWCPTISVFVYNKFPLDSTYKYLNRAYKAKLPIVMGTDIGSFPWDINETKELEYYVHNAGLTAMDAIKTATLNAAKLLGKQDQLGQIQKGFLADIIAVKGNPLDDIVLLQHVSFVMKAGKIVKKP